MAPETKIWYLEDFNLFRGMSMANMERERSELHGTQEDFDPQYRPVEAMNL